MEKLIYSLWRDKQAPGNPFRDDLLGTLGPELLRLPGIHGLRLCVVDDAVAAAQGRRMESHAPLPDAVLSLWVDWAGSAQDWEALLDRHVARRQSYLVVEAEPLASRYAQPVQDGERVPGMCQVVFLCKPAELARKDWLSIWQGSHTGIAIETQSTFGYRQNVVVRCFGDGLPPCDAIVEENFPAAAMSSDHAFYQTGGDEGLLQQRMTTMMESCARFIDFEHIDVIPMSEYVLKSLPGMPRAVAGTSAG